MLGYKIISGKAVIYTAEAEQVKGLFENYISCGSLSATAKATGLSLAHPSVKRILQNPRYKGDNFYPRIVDEGVFDKVQEMLEGKARSSNSKKGRKSRTLPPLPSCFAFRTDIEDCFPDDPAIRAEYLYSMIEVVPELSTTIPDSSDATAATVAPGGDTHTPDAHTFPDAPDAHNAPGATSSPVPSQETAIAPHQ